MFRRIVLIAACVLAGLGALAIRVVVEGRAALRAGDEAAAKGATIAAIDHYETAARWYLPLAPHVDEAYRTLHALAVANDPATAPSPATANAAIALAAWRAIRSAARATRSLWTPHAADLAAADAAIARLSARDPAAGQVAESAAQDVGPAAGEVAAGSNSGSDQGSAATPGDMPNREAWQRQRLAIDVRPSAFAAVLAGLGILLWLGGVVALVRRGVDRAGTWIRRPAVVSATAIVVGLVLWFAGLYNA